MVPFNATAATLCETLAAHTHTRPVFPISAHELSVEKTPSFSFCQVDMYAAEARVAKWQEQWDQTDSDLKRYNSHPKDRLPIG